MEIGETYRLMGSVRDTKGLGPVTERHVAVTLLSAEPEDTYQNHEPSDIWRVSGPRVKTYRGVRVKVKTEPVMTPPWLEGVLGVDRPEPGQELVVPPRLIAGLESDFRQIEAARAERQAEAERAERAERTHVKFMTAQADRLVADLKRQGVTAFVRDPYDRGNGLDPTSQHLDDWVTITNPARVAQLLAEAQKVSA